MAHHVLQRGFPLTIFSRSRGQAAELEAAGASIAQSPRDVGAASGIILTCLPTSTDLFSVLRGTRGVLRSLQARAIVVDMGTHSPESARTLAALVMKAGGEFLDAPISGGVQGAVDGTLAIMVGGPESTFLRALPVLESMGTTIQHIGETGAGQIAKACNQLVVGSTIEAVAEALVLAAASGVDPRIVRRVLLGGFAASRILELHGQRMLDHDFEPGARVCLHAKDARIVRTLARSVGVPVPGFEPVARALDQLERSGAGERDHSVLATRLEAASGVDLSKSRGGQSDGPA